MTNTTAGAAGLALGLVLGGGLFYVLSPGDEGPIRVKNGSVELHLLNTSRLWAPHGSNRQWRVSRGRRNHDDLELYVNSGPGATCGPRGSGPTVTINTSDGKTITPITRVDVSKSHPRTRTRP